MAEPIIEIVFDNLSEALDISSILFKEMGWNENGSDGFRKQVEIGKDEEGLFFALCVYTIDKDEEQGEE